MTDRIPVGGIAFLLSQLGGQSSRLWTARLAGLGMEPREVMLFRFVAQSEGRSQRAVAAAIGLPDSRIVGIVDRLEQRGWIERRASAADRRTRALHVTAAGRRALEQIAAVSAEHEADLSRGLDGREAALLRDLLGRIAAVQGLARGVHPGFADPTAEPAATGEALADQAGGSGESHGGHDRR